MWMVSFISLPPVIAISNLHTLHHNIEPDWLKEYDEVKANRDEVTKAKVHCMYTRIPCVMGIEFLVAHSICMPVVLSCELIVRTAMRKMSHWKFVFEYNPNSEILY